MATPLASRSVLFITTSYDSAPPRLEEALKRRGLGSFRFDTDRFPREAAITFDPERGVVFAQDGRYIAAASILSVWYRRHSTPALPVDITPGEREFAIREARALVIGAVLSLGERAIVSHPAALFTAENKPYQLVVARSLGFRVPITRITNQPDEVAAIASDRAVIAKAVSSGYVSVGDDNLGIFTSIVSQSDLADLDSLSIAPVTFQEHIPKQADIRVTVIGESVFATEIDSQSHESSRIDWRATTDPDIAHARTNLPNDVRDKCRLIVERLGLRFGAIDLVRSPSGSLYFLEINPNGEWVWIEDRVGYPIADALAEELDVR